MNVCAAAVDIGSREHMAAVNPDVTDMPVKAFGTFTHDLHDLAVWFKSHAVTSVAMESTGVYWIPAYGILEQHGFEVILSAPRDQVRSMQGYIGSVAFSADDLTIAVTSPRGGFVQTFDAHRSTFADAHVCDDVSGVVPDGEKFIVTSGTGEIRKINSSANQTATRHSLAWDNHLVTIQS